MSLWYFTTLASHCGALLEYGGNQLDSHPTRQGKLNVTGKVTGVTTRLHVRNQKFPPNVQSVHSVLISASGIATRQISIATGYELWNWERRCRPDDFFYEHAKISFKKYLPHSTYFKMFWKSLTVILPFTASSSEHLWQDVPVSLSACYYKQLD